MLTRKIFLGQTAEDQEQQARALVEKAVDVVAQLDLLLSEAYDLTQRPEVYRKLEQWLYQLEDLPTLKNIVKDLS